MTKITIGSVVYSETNEYPTRTLFENTAVSTVAPERLSIAQSWNKKAFGKRVMTVNLTKDLPHATINGGTFVEVLGASFKLTHIPDYLSDTKDSAIRENVNRLVTLLSDANFVGNLISGIHNDDVTVTA